MKRCMEDKKFWIATDYRHPAGDMIYTHGTGLRIRVYRVTDYLWEPDTTEVRLYGYAGDDLLVFETIGIKPDDALYMASAVHHYAVYLGYPEMLIFTREPERLSTTPDHNIKQSVNGAAASSAQVLRIVR